MATPAAGTGALEDSHVEGSGSAFGSLFDACLKAFLQEHSSLGWGGDCFTGSDEPFQPPQELLSQLQEETGFSLSSVADISTSSSTPTSGESQAAGGRWSLDLYRCFLLLYKVYGHLRLISLNESAAEISTPLLRFLLLPHCMGIMALERPEQIPDRLPRLRESQMYLLEYLQSLESAELLGKDECNRLECLLDAVADPSKPPASSTKNLDPATCRTKLIEAAREEKQLTTAIKAMLSQKASREASWDSEEERRLSLSLLQLCAKESFKQLDFIKQETPLLMMRLSHDRTAAASREDVRNFLRSRAFQPAHNLPTMSLAECADIEMETETKKIGAAKPKVVVEFPTGEAWQAAKEEKEMEARKWDDWKDEHPKGSGNKMCNRG
ncbi:immunoglobulin-binding protein 1 [Cyclospora cayetanensis]|uniref:Immunoglobulin-binding protein 1 n=1 Tax=Cyclospora cayetanensis TaxID=88456 RepID=A0A6P6RW23_9EIME|nr:immunoglobulin-binding protein 1 [Cyclospora cayetanensis]